MSVTQNFYVSGIVTRDKTDGMCVSENEKEIGSVQIQKLKKFYAIESYRFEV